MSIVPSLNTQALTLDKFGVPFQGSAVGGGILMPKLKHRFRVVTENFGVPGLAGNPITFTKQVATAGRPQIQHNNTPLHSYNNVVYIAQKPEWQPIEITLRDDITNAVSSLVSSQLQRQMNHFTQSAAQAHQNYKFRMRIQTLDGQMAAVNTLEDWLLEGCYLEQVQYDQMDYSSSEPTMITLTIRYDNATQGQEQFIPASSGATFPLIIPPAI